jgi:hydroxylamine reductase (hybrid-cluster protein)
MKNLLAAIFIFTILFTACSKKESPGFGAEQEVKIRYDTTAIDSFSTGAVSVDIARKIRMSSPQYIDSVKQAKKLQEEENKLKAELEKENKAKQEDEKKKSEAEKKVKTAEKPTSQEAKPE